MKRIQWFFVVLLVVFLPWQATAQEAALALPAGADVRIVVDMSGSMKETDPDNLRRPAVRLLARMLPENAEAGLWTFGQYVNMLVPHGTVNEAWRNTAIERSKQINSVALHTNLGLAIEKASNDWLSGGTLENTHLILLSDGKVDIPGGESASRAEESRILETLLPVLQAKGATIHTVGLSERADIEFLRQLAKATGGSFRLAQSAEALNLAFADALNTAVPQEQVPIEGDEFSVDDGVTEFTALIFSGGASSEPSSLQLAKPGGELFTPENLPANVRWAAEPGYDLITVTEPMAGAWRIVGDLGQGSRVTVVSNLRMAVSPIPPEFSAETPVNLEVAFFEGANAIQDADFLGVMDVKLSITAADGRRGTKVLSADQPPEDGIYRDTVEKLPVVGRYQIDVVADGGTFARKFSAMTSFVVPGEEAPVAVVSEPLVPDLSEQIEHLPFEGAEAPVEPESETAEAPEPGIEPAQTSVPDAVDPSAEPSVSESQVVEAEPEPADPVAEPEPESAPIHEPENGTLWGIPVWLYGAIAAVVVIVVGLGVFAVRQKKARAEQAQAAASARETVDDLPEEAAPPVLEEAATEPEPEPEPDPEPEPEPEPEPDPDPEPDPEPEPEPEPELAEDEEIPEVTETVESVDEIEEDEFPMAVDEVVEGVEDLQEDEPAEGLDDDLDEFALEDFDLSEFDDLPDFEDDPSEADESAQSTQDKAKKDQNAKK